MDIPAIKRLQERNDVHSKFPDPTKSNYDFDEFKSLVSTSTIDTTKCMKSVLEYGEKIKQEVINLRKILQVFNIHMGEKMKELLAAGLIKNVVPTTERNAPTYKLHKSNFDSERAGRILEMEKLAKQQQDLMEMMNEMENLICKVEEEGSFTLDDIWSIENNLEQWSKSLETEEESLRRKREEAEREERERRAKEEEKRRMEEAEKKRKEEEERRKKEEELRNKNERIRRNPENWPTFLYERYDNTAVSDFHKGVCCIVSAIQGHGGLVKDDLKCTCSDGINDLNGALSCREEMVQSSIITVKYVGQKDATLDEPMRIFIPYLVSKSAREVRVKVSVNGGKWETLDQLKCPPNKNQPDVTMQGTTVNNFSTLQLAVVSRPTRDNFIARADGNNIEPAKDEHWKLLMPPNCFPEDTDVHVKIESTKHMTKDAKELNNIQIATSLHAIEFARKLEQSSQLEMYPEIQDVDKSVDSKFHVVSSQNYNDWEIMNTERVTDITDAVYVSLPKGGKSFEIIGLVVPKNMDKEYICRAAETIYRMVNHTPVRILCKQSIKEPHDVLIQCVPSERVDVTLQEMKKRGFTEGPPESAEFGVCDGEQIVITPSGNLQFDPSTNGIKLTVFLNMDSAKSSAYIVPASKKAQASDKQYHGQLCYETLQMPSRTGQFNVFLPKEEEYQRYAPLSLNVPLKAMAKFLAFKLSQKDPKKLNDFYKRVAGSPGTQRSLQSRVAKESSTGSARENCELFILNWANQRPKNEDKVKTVLECLHAVDKETVAESEKFHRHYLNGILSNNYLERMGNMLGDSWEELAKRLNIVRENIEVLKIDFQDQQRRAVAMLDQFRLSNTAAEHGGDVGNFILKSAEQAKCGSGITKMIRDNI